MTGYVQDLRRYAPNTPHYAKSSRLQELGYFTTTGLRGDVLNRRCPGLVMAPLQVSGRVLASLA